HTSSFTAPGTGTLVQTTLPGQTAFTNTGLTQGVTYFYRLLAVDSQGNVSAQSNEQSYTPVDTTPPTISSSSPTNGATGIAFATSASVTFSEAMTVAATQGAYAIKETNCTGTTVSTGSPAASGGNATFTYSLTNLKPSTVYAHCVTTAATDAATSPNALAADYSATWTTGALTEPTGVTATAGNTTVSIAFTVGNGNGGVKIVSATGSAPADCSGTAIYTGSTSPYVHTTLLNGTQYFYRVCSTHNSGAYLSAGVTASATPTDAFNVNSAASTGNTTATVTFSAAPVTSEAQTAGNYKIVAGAGVCTDASALSVSAAVLAGNVVTLTTAAQTASTSCKVCVTGVTRNSDGATLTTNNANFTGTGAGSLVISQVYGGGGNSGAPYTNDFIEIFNPTSSSISVAGWSVQYASAAGTTWQVTSLTGSVPANSYYLIQQAAGGTPSGSLPTPNATGTIAMSGTAGKVALVNTTTALTTAAFTGTSPTGSQIIDFVG
ncbi:MAG: lamin tail domain-containing protein, partial [Turneriella sp.]